MEVVEKGREWAEKPEKEPSRIPEIIQEFISFFFTKLTLILLTSVSLVMVPQSPSRSHDYYSADVVFLQERFMQSEATTVTNTWATWRCLTLSPTSG